ncbi:MAG: DUF3124 domain-containing protein [Magnetococcales bacterium]|nr:DUF3124 domain-containing protein [Magnetococcales bacterium]
MSRFRRIPARIAWVLIVFVPFVATGVAAMEQYSLSTGQTVYVPVYSSLLHGNLNELGQPERVLLSSMLSVRSTDPVYPMIIKSVEYYNSVGQLLRQYLPGPVVLQPLATADFFVENREKHGGTGANFMVVWHSDQPINQPIMETVQVYHWGTQAQAFASRGQVVHVQKPATSP